MKKNLRETLSEIKLLALDVDGVLTDGRLLYTESGEIQKSFGAQDGMGIIQLRKRGFPVALITLDISKTAEYRAKRLGIEEVCIKCDNKVKALEEICHKYNIGFENVAFVGDDLADLPVLEVVGLPIAVGNAIVPVKKAAKIVTPEHGGRGAVRRICDMIINALDSKFSFAAIIPARYESARLPGKVLEDMGGVPMLVRTYRQALLAGLDETVVATDDSRIMEVCRAFDCRCIQTSSRPNCGSERCAEACKELEADFIINIQADEPFISPEDISELADMFAADPWLEMASLMRKSSDIAEIVNPGNVKVVCDTQNRALYFSRSPIPYGGEISNRYIHIGAYAFRRDVLLRYSELQQSPLEKAEKLEQLRALENGIKISMLETGNSPLSINTAHDLEKAREMLAAKEAGK